MKRFVLTFAPMLLAWSLATGNCQGSSSGPGAAVDVDNQVNAAQQVNVIGGGNGGGGGSADSYADSSSEATGGTGYGLSNSSVDIDTTSVANYKTRVQPTGVAPPYLPLWNHAGWGTVKGYFANGPTGDETVYERTFDPDDADDMAALHGIISNVPYSGPLGTISGFFNGIGVALGGPDNFHHGRGFDIASSIVRDRRPKKSPMVVFIDSTVDRNVIRAAGYVYVGKVSVEAKTSLSWDLAFNAAVAEALPWDVDILLVAGGMKGVTTGTNNSFPGVGFGYGQANYSVSLYGATSTGITEAQGKPVVSADGYRYCPRMSHKQDTSRKIYERIKARATANVQAAQTQRAMAQLQLQLQLQAQAQLQTQRAAASIPAPIPVPTRSCSPYNASEAQGVQVSPELLEQAGFRSEREQQIDYMSAVQSQTNP